MNVEALHPARAVALCAAFCAAAAAQAQPDDALALMRRIHDATQKLSYRGTFVYQQGNRSETSRITRFVAPDGDIERLEVLDGVPREIVRTRNVVRCYLPDSRVVKIERRTDRSFPALLPERVATLTRHYDIKLGESRRIAGYDCRAVMLTPRDNLRYGYRLYADAKTGMLLKAITVDNTGERIEQFTFTQLTLGNVTREMVRASHPATKWRIEDAAAAPARLDGWSLSAELPGFRKVMELKRRMGDARAVGQVVYSDGLAAVSVFIEPLEARRAPLDSSVSGNGALHMFSRAVANFRVTVVGDAPAASVQRIANAVEYRPQ